MTPIPPAVDPADARCRHCGACNTSECGVCLLCGSRTAVDCGIVDPVDPADDDFTGVGFFPEDDPADNDIVAFKAELDVLKTRIAVDPDTPGAVAESAPSPALSSERNSFAGADPASGSRSRHGEGATVDPAAVRDELLESLKDAELPLFLRRQWHLEKERARKLEGEVTVLALEAERDAATIATAKDMIADRDNDLEALRVEYREMAELAQGRLATIARLEAEVERKDAALRAVKATEKTALPGRFINLAHLRKAMLLVDAALSTKETMI